MGAAAGNQKIFMHIRQQQQLRRRGRCSQNTIHIFVVHWVKDGI